MKAWVITNERGDVVRWEGDPLELANLKNGYVARVVDVSDDAFAASIFSPRAEVDACRTLRAGAITDAETWQELAAITVAKAKAHAVLDAALNDDLAEMLHVLYDMEKGSLEALHEAASKVAKEALDACDCFEDFRAFREPGEGSAT